MPSTSSLPLLSFSLLLLLPLSLSLCPTPLPPIKSSLIVRTKQVAQIPKEGSDPARIICIKPFANSRKVLAVLSGTKIYLVNVQTAAVSVFMDVARAFASNGRKLNIDDGVHGGLRSIAFHPRFKTNKLFYIAAMEQRPSNPSKFKYISDKSEIAADSVLVEYRMGKNGLPNIASYRLLFRVGMPVFDHPIKQIAFYGSLLYIAHGDGSVQSAIAGGGLRNDALGKILRINPLKSGNSPYTIPRSNKFNVKNSRFPREAFAVGFRNPHNICFSNAGALFVADAGRDNYEEVNIARNGGNYGWSKREGICVHNERGATKNGVDKLPSDDARFGFTYPAALYSHEDFNVERIGIAGGCPVQNVSPMAGKYWYADFPMSGRLYYSDLRDMFNAVTRGNPAKLTQAKTKQVSIWFKGKVYKTLYDVLVADGLNNPRADMRFGRGTRGELYWSSKKNGKLYVFTSSMPGATQ